MSTMVVRMDCKPDVTDEVVRHLRHDVVVWAQEQDGFVAGSWHVSDDGHWGIGVVEFSTREEAERAAVAPPFHHHDPTVPFRIARVEVYEQVAEASPRGQ